MDNLHLMIILNVSVEYISKLVIIVHIEYVIISAKVFGFCVIIQRMCKSEKNPFALCAVGVHPLLLYRTGQYSTGQYSSLTTASSVGYRPTRIRPTRSNSCIDHCTLLHTPAIITIHPGAWRTLWHTV